MNADLERVEQDVAYALYTYLNPLVGGSTEGLGEGWEFGRALNQGELYGIVRKIEGVEFIKILRVYETDLATGKQDPKPAGSYLEIGRGRGDRLRDAHRQGRARGALMSSTAFGTSPNGHTSSAASDHEPARSPVGDRNPGGRLRARLPAAQPAERSTRTATSGCASSSALETLLDPIVGTLDVLDSYFHPTLAPRDVLDLLAAWLGLRVDESWPDERLREALGREGELSRRRGTAAGPRRSRSSIAFPDIPLRVEDGGGVTWSTDPSAPDEGAPAELCGLLRHADPREDPARDRARDRGDQAGARDLPLRVKAAKRPTEAPTDEPPPSGKVHRWSSARSARPRTRTSTSASNCGTYLRWDPTRIQPRRSKAATSRAPPQPAELRAERWRPPAVAAATRPPGEPSAPRRHPSPMRTMDMPVIRAGDPRAGGDAGRGAAAHGRGRPDHAQLPRAPWQRAEARRRGRRARAPARARPQPERDRRQLRDPGARHAGGVVERDPAVGLPRPVRRPERHLRAGGADQLPPAAQRGGGGAALGARGRRRLARAERGRRHDAREDRDHAVRAARERAAARSSSPADAAASSR